MSPSFDPIAPWPLIALAALVIVGLTLWAYRKRLRGTTGRWRWVALGLRLAAVLLCVLAALRPSMLILRKLKQTATVVFLTDVSKSMSLGGEAAGQTRYQAARNTLEQGMEAVKSLGPDTVAKSLIFSSSVREDPPDQKVDPEGRITALGDALEDTLKRFSGSKILRIVLLSDGASNSGRDPRSVAQLLRSQQVPVVTVGFGSETVGSTSRDIGVREMLAGPIVYAKTELEVKGMLTVRGYTNETLDLELLVEGHTLPVAQTKVKVPEGVTEIPFRGLKWTPEVPGEKKVTVRVAPRPDELVKANNEYSTFVTVLKGGINVLYVQGPSSPWEKKFLARALDASDKIQLTLQVLFEPAGRDFDAELRPGKFDVFILGDLPADFLTREQQRLLADAVRKGAGLMMLGGRSSFGAGGWARTELADLLPVEIHPGDGQLEPDSGLKVVPNILGLDSYVLRLAPTRAESQKIWSELPPISGTNRFEVKKAAYLWALSPEGQALMAAIEPGKGRVLAFGSEGMVRRRDLALGPLFRGQPPGSPQLLAQRDPLALAQGGRGRQPDSARARSPATRARREDGTHRHRPERQGGAAP